MKKYALDTNIVSYILKENPGVIIRFQAASDAGDRLIIPLMVYYEVKRGLLDVGSPRKMQHFERFCNLIGVDDMRFDVLDKAAYIYDNLRRIGRLVDDTALRGHYQLRTYPLAGREDLDESPAFLNSILRIINL